MASSHIRKVQLTGGSTFVVSLPKSWAKSVGLSPGDSVEISVQPDLSLLVTHGKTSKREPAEVTIDVSTAELKEDAVREFIACYLAGYDIIHVKFGRPTIEYRSYLKDVMRRKLIGVEVMEESAYRLDAQCLLGYVEFPISSALSRMYVMSLSMYKDAIESLRRLDFSLAEDVTQRDDEVDRLYFFIVRQLKKAVRDAAMIREIGLSSARDCLGYRLIAKSMERIADHAARIAKIVPTLENLSNGDVVNVITEMSSISMESYKRSMSSLFKLDVKRANQAIKMVSDVVQKEEEAINLILQANLDLRTVIGLRLIIESIRRIAEYGTDIAEIVINLSIKQA